MSDAPSLDAPMEGTVAMAGAISSQNQTKKQKTHKKQHRWTEEKTLTFFKIVDIHRPFDAQYGTSAAAWEKTTKEYNSSINEEGALSVKAARDHYKSILKKHRETATRSEKASGIAEEVTGLTTVLDAAVEQDDSLIKMAEEVDKKKQKKVKILNLV